MAIALIDPGESQNRDGAVGKTAMELNDPGHYLPSLLVNLFDRRVPGSGLAVRQGEDVVHRVVGLEMRPDSGEGDVLEEHFVIQFLGRQLLARFQFRDRWKIV